MVEFHERTFVGSASRRGAGIDTHECHAALSDRLSTARRSLRRARRARSASRDRQVITLARHTSPHLAPIVDEWRRRGVKVEQCRAPYEFQRGVDTMLCIVGN
jgi:hypothetical protein